MAQFPDTSPEPRRVRPRRRRSGWTLRITPRGVVIIMLVNLILMIVLAFGLSKLEGWPPRLALSQSPTPTGTSLVETPVPSPSGVAAIPATPTPTSPDPSATSSPEPVVSSTPAPPTPIFYPLPTLTLDQGMLILALNEGGVTHLFAYQPQGGEANQPLPLTRLTYGPWDDITPALSPDKERIAFASNRNGYWDIYLLDLPSGLVTRVTDSLEYDASPSWSPDGLWLVYETYVNDNLEIMILSVDGEETTISLTNHPAADHSPVWSPQGRQIAFVSNRSGESEVWLADLDKGEEERYRNISRNTRGSDAHPAWSPDGTALAWAGVVDGFHNLYVWETGQPDAQARPVGSGDWPVWSPDGETLLTTLLAPNQTYLTAYPLRTSGLALPPLSLPWSVAGLVWDEVSLSWPLRDPYKQAAILTPTPLWLPALTSVPEESGGRLELVPIEDVEAPQAMLHDFVDEAFQALRSRLSTDIGWDFLSTLENAYVPLTSPLGPGMGDDWLYTGRAFAFNSLPMSAGWLAVVREDFGQQTYWRVYLRTRYQDGSAGVPLHHQPWDFYARFSGDTTVYEQGGQLVEALPPGYWVDFTQWAALYGWERLPALSTWRAAYPAARFNEFIMSAGLDWRTAMLELYPLEALVTPSPIVPPTRTPTPTSRWYQTPTTTLTPTLRPTFTPIVPTPTTSLTPTSIPVPSATATTTPRLSPTPSPTPTPELPTETPGFTESPTGMPSGSPTPGE